MAARLSLVLYLGFSCLRPASATWVERQSVDNSSDTGFQEVFQVGAPLRDNFEGFTCQQVIVDHEFAASYGTPYVGKLPSAMSTYDERENRILESG